MATPSPASPELWLEDVGELLEVHETRDPVAARKSGDEMAFVFIHATLDVVRNPCVQHSGATRHDVHIVNAHAGMIARPILGPSSVFFFYEQKRAAVIPSNARAAGSNENAPVCNVASIAGEGFAAPGAKMRTDVSSRIGNVCS